MKSFHDLDSVCAVILAAGRGTRMKLGKINKVTLHVAGEPMIVRTIRILKDSGVNNIVVVVGHLKDSVTKLLPEGIIVVEQKKRLGTAHAVSVALTRLPQRITRVVVLNGDDAFFLNESLLTKLLQKSFDGKAGITFLSLKLENPGGLGRVIRHKNKIVGIVEEKDATEQERNIHEVNAACYVFTLDFLKKNITKVKKSPASGEYYIVDMVRLAKEANVPIETVVQSDLQWRGVNTIEEFKIAEKLLSAE